MIARVWHGWTKTADAESYESHLKPELLPELSKVKGFLGSHLLRRREGNEVEFITVIFWESLDALRALTGFDYETAMIPEDRRKYLVRFGAKAAHYEVISSQKPLP